MVQEPGGLGQSYRMRHDIHFLVFLMGAAIVGALLLRIGLQRVRVPALVGYFALGIGIGWVGDRFHLLQEQGIEIFEFLAELGVIALIFRIGLESDFAKLLGQLRRASGIWLTNVIVSGVGGYATAYWLLQMGLIPSLIIGVAFTATSVGVALGTWREAGALKSERGELLLDVAEMDDLSAILLMGLLFALLPDLQTHQYESLWGDLGLASGWFILKLTGLAALCFVFARYGERLITGFVRKMTSNALLVVVGIGIMIAALAGMLGFSAAIGAFFAGLIFSRDPEAVKIDASFQTLYDFLTPFFFIGIGLTIEPSAIGGGLGIGLVLASVAIVVKVLGAGLPAIASLGTKGAVLIGVSMVPRAEISLVIMKTASDLGTWAVPHELFAGMVVVSAITSVLAPILLFPLLRRWQK